MTFEAILKDLHSGNWLPVYFLQGEESYFVNQISNYIEENVLKEEEKGFNQSVLYGRDTEFTQLNEVIRRYPMMSVKQVVILKEAQQMKGLDKLASYFKNPVPSTVFVIHYNGKKLRSNSVLAKAIKTGKGLIYTADKIPAYKLGDWLGNHLRGLGLQIKPKAAELLIEYLGNDLQKINNSLEKILINIPESSTITSLEIEKYIGISKDYNVFELNNAIMQKDVLKANRIVKYFTSNPKAGPIPVVIAALYGLFEKILLLHHINTTDRNAVASNLRIGPYFVNDYIRAASGYDKNKAGKAVRLLSEFDLKSKGVGAVNSNPGSLMQELVYKLLHL